ncbi:hypothetical protein C9374_005940 [Naegleria lovaniensis]|uniref:Uncharacterized protein n=1 Tax=Naegleria lovaniensis TaxID=51637 RepID=A0AA88GIF0_NAELO|nr:uncharacterized protein C9374_005940 [Naegleria lovaniensis]KAG2381556.1 hypothetical protein C9374_005940 [Naegleria lovaniensis]
MSHHSKKCVEKPLRKEQGCVASSKQLAREQRSSHEHACISSSFSMIQVNESPSMHALTFNSSPNIKKHATKKQRNDTNSTTPTTVSSSNPFDGSYSFSSYLNIPVSKEFTGRGENTSSLTRVNDASSSSEHLQGKRGRKFKIPPEFQPSMLERTRAAQQRFQMIMHATFQLDPSLFPRCMQGLMMHALQNHTR